MTIILIMLGLVIVAVITGSAASSIQFGKEVKALFASSGNAPTTTFSHNQLQGLPDPVQRYFKHVMREGQPYISYIRLKHDGQFKTEPQKSWMNIAGEQYFTTERPGFIWRGSTPLFTAKDMYILDKGRLVVSLFGLVKIAGGQGEKYDQAELLRWLAESVWFPTNLLPNENLQWTAVDNQTAQLHFTYLGFSLKYLVTFNLVGEITALQTSRHMGEGKLETWVGKISNYKQLNGIFIPTTIEAIYKLQEGDYSYARFTVKKIQYGIPEKF